MRRTLQWVRGFFGTSTKKSQPATTSQLGHADKETSDPIFLAVDEVSGSLQEGLLSWLLNVEPHQLEKTDERTSAIVAQLESRISSGKLEELPRQPLILPKLLQALSKENSDRRELVSIILKDPALTNRVLQVANSPFFRSGDQHIESVDQAVFLLGHRGIRNVVSASIMQPMLAARDNAETLFSERVWQWGMTCARSAEAVAISKGVDSGAHFLLGLLPALSYITLRREVQRLYKDRCNREEVPPSLFRAVFSQFDWATARLVAQKWSLPSSFQASLPATTRPTPMQYSTPLRDGIMLGTREVLRHVNHPTLTEEELRQVMLLEEPQFDRIRGAIAGMLEKEGSPA